MSECSLGANFTIAHVGNGRSSTKLAEKVMPCPLFVDHFGAHDDGQKRQYLDSAAQIVPVPNYDPKYDVTSERIEEVADSFNHSLSVRPLKRKDNTYRHSTSCNNTVDGVKAASQLSASPFHQPTAKPSQQNDSEYIEVHASENDLLAFWGQEQREEQRNDDVFARQEENQDKRNYRERRNKGVEQDSLSAPPESVMFWLHGLVLLH
jgi:hypothetical protein